MIIGDAAHPFLPYVFRCFVYLGHLHQRDNFRTSIQGASQGVEDGVALATVLDRAGKNDIPLALRVFEHIRLESCTNRSNYFLIRLILDMIEFVVLKCKAYRLVIISTRTLMHEPTMRKLRCLFLNGSSTLTQKRTQKNCTMRLPKVYWRTDINDPQNGSFLAAGASELYHDGDYF